MNLEPEETDIDCQLCELRRAEVTFGPNLAAWKEEIAREGSPFYKNTMDDWKKQLRHVCAPCFLQLCMKMPRMVGKALMKVEHDIPDLASEGIWHVTEFIPKGGE